MLSEFIEYWTIRCRNIVVRLERVHLLSKTVNPRKRPSAKEYTVLLTAARLAEVQSHQLHHVRFQQVHVPPRFVLGPRQGAGLRRVSLAAASVNRALRNPAVRGARLHRRLAACHVQNCDRESIQLIAIDNRR